MYWSRLNRYYSSTDVRPRGKEIPSFRAHRCLWFEEYSWLSRSPIDRIQMASRPNDLSAGIWFANHRVVLANTLFFSGCQSKCIMLPGSSYSIILVVFSKTLRIFSRVFVARLLNHLTISTQNMSLKILSNQVSNRKRNRIACTYMYQNTMKGGVQEWIVSRAMKYTSFSYHDLTSIHENQSPLFYGRLPYQNRRHVSCKELAANNKNQSNSKADTATPRLKKCRATYYPGQPQS